MKEKRENFGMRLFSAKTEKRFYTVVGIYVVAVIIFQSARFIIQNF